MPTIVWYAKYLFSARWMVWLISDVLELVLAPKIYKKTLINHQLV